MFESTGQAASAGGAPSDGGSPPVDIELGQALAAGEVAFEAVPCEPAARVAWLCEELSRVGLRVAAGEVDLPSRVEGDPSALSRVSPVLAVAAVDGVRVDVLGLLERVKSVAAAAQARVTVAFAASQEAAAMAELGVSSAPEPERASEVRPETARRRERAMRLARSSVVGQVGLARRISPARASACVAAARAWTSDLPTTLAALDAGEVSEWGAEIVARETATLTPQLRRTVDEQVGAGLRCWSERQIRAAVVARGYALDPQAAVKRHEKAVGQRRVSTRAAEDGMVWLSALLPVVQGIACQATLSSAASAAKAGGDERGTGQLMADLLVQAVTGQSAGTPDLPGWVTDPTRWGSGDAAGDSGDAAGDGDGASDGANDVGTAGPARRAPAPSAPSIAGPLAGPTAGPPLVPVEVQLVVSAEALWGDPDDPGSDHPAHVPGYGPIPAWLARHLVLGAPDAAPGCAPHAAAGPRSEADQRLVESCPDAGARAATFLRRLWACPDTGALVALESRRRIFDGGLRRFLIARDQTCRTPYCDAPIRHGDHVTPHTAGGPTSAANGQGLCARCNQTKEAPGWRSDVLDDVLDDVAAPDRAVRHPRAAPATAHAVRVTTPTGRTYRSSAPSLLPIVTPITTPSRKPSARSTAPASSDRRRSRRPHRGPDHRLRAFLLRT